jgi:hypothetical protein
MSFGLKNEGATLLGLKSQGLVSPEHKGGISRMKVYTKV